jgi:hypothetical protein
MRSGTVVAAIVGIVLGAGGVWVITRANQLAVNPNPAPTPTNAPVVVRGGTTHGTAELWSADVSQPPQTVYSGAAKNSNHTIYTYYLAGAPSQITDNDGWVINFYNQMDAKTPAVQLCSNDKCDHATIASDNLVSIRTGTTAIFEILPPGELHYHNLSTGCDDYPKSNKESKNCDDLGHVGIIVGGATGVEKVYPCGGKPTPVKEGKCDVSVGDTITDP